MNESSLLAVPLFEQEMKRLSNDGKVTVDDIAIILKYATMTLGYICCDSAFLIRNEPEAVRQILENVSAQAAIAGRMVELLERVH